mmetsp:Transcript_121445/g.238612  ORF Transcript_121445/g.238612 Transcript_121445/m.238612 type:complete len:275 (-) Transcript_121445:18-842(-)
MWCTVYHWPYLLPATECILGCAWTTVQAKEPEFTLRSSRSHLNFSSARSSKKRNVRIVTARSSARSLTRRARSSRPASAPVAGSSNMAPSVSAMTSKMVPAMSGPLVASAAGSVERSSRSHVHDSQRSNSVAAMVDTASPSKALAATSSSKSNFSLGERGPNASTPGPLAELWEEAGDPCGGQKASDALALAGLSLPRSVGAVSPEQECFTWPRLSKSGLWTRLSVPRTSSCCEPWARSARSSKRRWTFMTPAGAKRSESRSRVLPCRRAGADR